jgi:MoaA/NifB/PqqE/SkfB family radical SAM enzyme
MRNKELTLEITQKCQLECRWCSSEASPKGEHVPVGVVKNKLMTWQSMCNVVRISGGEPLLHPDLDRILWEARYHKFHVVLLTNGQEALPYSERDKVDEFVVHMANTVSFATVGRYKKEGRNVSMHVVAVEGNEAIILDALHVVLEQQIPLRILKLQKQGRGESCEPSKLITFTGDLGCREHEKITITHDDKLVTCSALKGATCERV